MQESDQISHKIINILDSTEQSNNSKILKEISARLGKLTSVYINPRSKEQKIIKSTQNKS